MTRDGRCGQASAGHVFALAPLCWGDCGLAESTGIIELKERLKV